MKDIEKFQYWYLFLFSILIFLFFTSLSCRAISKPQSENQERRYSIVFKEWKPEYRQEILSIEGIHYVQDIYFYGPGNIPHPTMIISAAPDKYQQLDGLYRESRFPFIMYISPFTEIKPLFMPRLISPKDWILEKIKNISLWILAISIISIITNLVLGRVIYKTRRKGGLGK